MTMMTDQTDMRAVMDPEGVRDSQLVAVLVLRTLMEKALPVVTWHLDTRLISSEYTVILNGNIFRSRSYSAGEEFIELGDRDAVVRDALRRWAAEFDAEIKITPFGGAFSAACQFEYAGVRVEIGAIVDEWPEDDARPEDVR